MNKRILFSIGLIVLLLSSCSVGSRRVVTEDIKVNSFDQIDFTTIGELTITQGDRKPVTIEAESNVMSRIKTSVRGGTLYIEMKSGVPWVWSVVPTKPISARRSSSSRLVWRRARICVDTGLAVSQLPDGYQRRNDVYTSPGYASADNRVDLEVSQAIGKITIRQSGTW